jgi:nucleotide-binding universal stress UspA family protein
MFRAVALDKLTLPLKGMRVNPKVARRLPFDLACRYQSLPVAEDDGHLTVAMAHPNDMEARQAILSALLPVGPRDMEEHPALALCPAIMAPEQQRQSEGIEDGIEVDSRGASVYLVRGEPAAIDSLLADVWPGKARRPLRLLVVDTMQDRAGLRDYAQALGRLLGAEHASIICDDAAIGVDAATGDDAVPNDRPSPRQRLLLVVPGNDDPSGPAALDWAVRLAKSSGAAVTVLAAVPAGPQRSLLGDERNLTALLTTDSTVVGQAAQRLVQAGIAATLRLRQGLPDHQLHCEVIETDYDLVLVSSKPILAFGPPNASDMASRARPPGTI